MMLGTTNIKNFSYGFFLMWFPRWKSSVLNCTGYSRTKQIYVTLFFTHVAHSRLNWAVGLRWFSVTVRTKIVPAVCESRSCR